MLILTNPGTADLISVITSSTAPTDVHASHIDASVASPPVPDQPGRTNTAITTAATTTVVAGPASGKVRNVKTLHIRNKSTTASQDVTVNHNIGGTLCELFKATLTPGDVLEYVEGIGFFVVKNVLLTSNKSVAVQNPGTSDVYLVGSSILIPAGSPTVGMLYVCTFDMSKTAAGTATPILNVRVGTAGTTADTSRGTHTFSAGTAAVDTGTFTFQALFRTVGSGTSAVLQSRCTLDSNPTTGLSSLIKTTVATSGGFDSTVANLIIGLSFNGGASFAGTCQLVESTITQR